MLIAKLDGDTVLEMGSCYSLFPGTSFSELGPDAEFLEANNAVFVDNNPVYDQATHKLVTVPAYVDGSVVRTVEVQALSQAELDANEAARKQRLLDSVMASAGAALDKFAKDRGYGSIISICTYDSSSVPRYAADALRARTLRDAWWSDLNDIYAEIQAGTRPEPANFAELEAELPPLTWT